jgi:TPR repeat protein
MNRIFPVILLSIFFLLQPNKLHAQLGQCPTCKKAIANCPYEGKHPVPQKTVSFLSSDPCHPMLLFIDGDRKDSITAYSGGSYSCALKYGTHYIVATAQDMEDYKETITVDKNTAPRHPIKANRAFNGKSADQISIIGDYYANGTNGRKKDTDEAYLWYEKAAEIGNVSAGYSAGKILMNRRRKGDYEKALELFRTSAEHGHVDSQYELGCAYYYGKGVEKNYQEALKWFEKASAQNHIEAWWWVGVFYFHAWSVDRDYTKAMECFKKSAGYEVAQDWIGYMYENGLGVKTDKELAKEWYLKSAQQGYAPAQKRLGDYYATTSMVLKTDTLYNEVKKGKIKKDNVNVRVTRGKNYWEAAKWYLKAADQDDAEAQKKLADLFAEGKGVGKDPLTAIEWYRKAINNYGKNNDFESAYKVGKILIPYIKEEYIKAPASNKKQYANDLGGLSFHAILQKEYVEAEAAAKEAIAADETQHWIYTNLAASLLLQGKVAEAETIYTQWKTEFKWAFLNDFRLFEDMNILTDEQKKDVEMIKNKLRE